MTDEKCPNDALYQYPWAGKIIKACKVHTNAMVILGKHMGGSIQAQAIMPTKCEHKNDLDEFERESNE